MPARSDLAYTQEQIASVAATAVEDFVLHVTEMPVSIVCLGDFNPAILNHDFLTHNGILPLAEEPFRTLAVQPQPFTEFTSTPLLSFIKYDGVQLVVDQSRLNVVIAGADESSAMIIAAGIVERYLAVLRHTPVRVYGVNVGRLLRFSDPEASRSALGRLFAPVEALEELLGPGATASQGVFAGVESGFRWKVDCRSVPDDACAVSITANHEYDFVSVERLAEHLGEAGMASARVAGVAARLGGLV